MQPRLPQLCCLQRQLRLRLRRRLRLRVRLRVKLWLGPRLWLWVRLWLRLQFQLRTRSAIYIGIFICHLHFPIPPFPFSTLAPSGRGLVNNRAHFICISNAWKVSQLVKFICEFCNMCPVGASWKLFTWNLADASLYPFSICHLPFTRPGIQFHLHSQSALAATQLAMPQSLWFSRLMKISFGIKAKFFFSSLLPFHLPLPPPAPLLCVCIQLGGD